MAGSLAMVASEHLDLELDKAMASIRDEWQIHFSRYLTYPYPSLSSTCPSLIPLPHNLRYRLTRGTWISTSAHTASLRIINNRSIPDAILSVCFRGKILEEHYITKLHFSWPQVSCVTGFPARGSRAVFVSYVDSVGEIQKFALRFSTLHEVETFINDLKEILVDATEVEPLNSDFRSEISSQSEFMSSNIPPSRARGEELSFMTPVHDYTPQMPPPLNYEVEQQSCTQKTKLYHNFQGISPVRDHTPQMPPPLNYEVKQQPCTQKTTLTHNFQGISPVHDHTTHMPPHLNYEVKQQSCTQKTTLTHNFQGISPALPPSFMSLLTNCCSEVKEAAGQQTVSEEIELKSQIMRYMEDHTFQDMLIKVEKVISEMGEDLSL